MKNKNSSLENRDNKCQLETLHEKVCMKKLINTSEKNWKKPSSLHNKKKTIVWKVINSNKVQQQAFISVPSAYIYFMYVS